MTHAAQKRVTRLAQELVEVELLFAHLGQFHERIGLGPQFLEVL
ncbi:hypothetical protein [Streptomyces lushanensis]